jgi:uncharacterized protein YbbK (DUF523 family)
VLSGAARVLGTDGSDVTAEFLAGAQSALAVARSFGIRLAVLKEGSPSCGTLSIYDGTFRGRRTPGQGVTTALLESNGIRVFTEEHVDEAAEYLRTLES